MPVNICKFCNKTFETFSRPSKACSIRCRKKLLEKETGYYTKYHQSRKVGKGKDFTFNCKICSKPFETRNPNQKYCSKDCRKESNKLNSKLRYTPVKPTLYHKTCHTCKKDFTAKREHAKYCKKKCKPSG